jgi:aryl-alcohol dehydrogenase-like predicted oxidoreductase
MKKNHLGQTGCLVSPIGLGTVKIGRNQQVKYPDAFEIPDDTQVKALLNTARDSGINLIDTAPAYGASEQRLGELLPGKRADWHIVSKVGEEFMKGESVFNFTPEHMMFSIKRSLTRLRTDYIDTLLVHSDGNDVALIKQHGVLEVVAEAKRLGYVRCFGMSTKTVAGGLLAVEQSDVVMVTYNLEHTEEVAVIEHAHTLNKGVLIKKALASGHHCADGTDPVKKSFSHVFAQAGVSSAIVGTINPKHLTGNAQLASALSGPVGRKQ